MVSASVLQRKQIRPHNRELDISRSKLCTEIVDVLDPFVVILQPIGRDTNNLHVSFGKVIGSSSDFPELRSAYGSKVTGVREEDCL